MLHDIFYRILAAILGRCKAKRYPPPQHWRVVPSKGRIFTSYDEDD